MTSLTILGGGQEMVTREGLVEAVELLPANADRSIRYRVAKFMGWLAGRAWHDPDLAAYRDWMITQGYASATIQAHLSTMRSQYARLARDNGTRDHLYRLAAGTTDSKVEQKAFVDETITRLKNAANPANSKVVTITKQDVPDSDHLRLSREQAQTLMAVPDTSTLKGIRDAAIIALLLCTGIREQELVDLDVLDLREKLGGELALRIRKGKGNKQRLVPYGALSWTLLLVDAWLEAADIRENGPVFRGLHKGGGLRPGRLSVRAVQYILAACPIAVEGNLVAIKPHDCRRTYARRLYEAGVSTVAVQQNLGHADLKTTLGYIGVLDADQRRAPAIYSMPELHQLGF